MARVARAREIVNRVMLGCIGRFKAAAARRLFRERRKSFDGSGEDHPSEVKQGGRGATATAARAGGPESYVMSSAISRADLSPDHAEED